MPKINLKSGYTWLVVSGLMGSLAILTQPSVWSIIAIVWAVISGIVAITKVEL